MIWIAFFAMLGILIFVIAFIANVAKKKEAEYHAQKDIVTFTNPPFGPDYIINYVRVLKDQADKNSDVKMYRDAMIRLLRARGMRIED